MHIGTWREVVGFAIIQFRPRITRCQLKRIEANENGLDRNGRSLWEPYFARIVSLYRGWRQEKSRKRHVHPPWTDTWPRCTCLHPVHPAIFAIIVQRGPSTDSRDRYRVRWGEFSLSFKYTCPPRDRRITKLHQSLYSINNINNNNQFFFTSFHTFAPRALSRSWISVHVKLEFRFLAGEAEGTGSLDSSSVGGIPSIQAVSCLRKRPPMRSYLPRNTSYPPANKVWQRVKPTAPGGRGVYLSHTRPRIPCSLLLLRKGARWNAMGHICHATPTSSSLQTVPEIESKQGPWGTFL